MIYKRHKTILNDLKPSKTTKNNQCENLTDLSKVFVLGFRMQVGTCFRCTNPNRIPIPNTRCKGALFRLGTPHSGIPLCITFRSRQGETQKHGSTCLLRITMGLQMSLEKFIPKGRIVENFYPV